MENSILKQDLEELSRNTEYLKLFEDKSVLVTGATGLIGSILVKGLLSSNNVTVYACCRSKEKFDFLYKDYLTEKLICIVSDIKELDISKISLDYIVHGASITDSKTFVEKPVDTIDIALDGTRNLLKQCIGKKIEGFVYLSSLEVYGAFNNYNTIVNVRENDFGYIDSLSVRSSYSEGKRMVENICKAYQVQYGIPVKIARLCQTFGAGVSYQDNRVFAQFAKSVIEYKNIILRTKGETVRNYCYTTDAVSGILCILAKGKIGEAYNVANLATTISIVDMAQLFCDLYKERKIKVIYELDNDISKLGYNPIVKLQLDSSKLQDLGWSPKNDLSAMIRKLVSSMAVNKQ